MKKSIVTLIAYIFSISLGMAQINENVFGSGGTITIAGGTVIATGGSYAAGIGGGNGGNAGTFTMNDNAIVFASSIGDTAINNRSNGILFVGDNASGTFYGSSVVMTDDVEIPNGYTLNIETGKSLTIPAGKRLINNGIITNCGAIALDGIREGNKITPSCLPEISTTATYGDLLSDTYLPAGWEWESPADFVGTAGLHTHKATFIPQDTANYYPIIDIDVIVMVEKANSTIPTDITAVYGDLLSNVALPEGWEWNNPSDLVGNAGERAHIATFTPEDTANYNIMTDENLSIMVEKARLSVTTDDQTREYGDENPLFPILYSGWKNGEDVTALTTVPSVACAANEASNVGTYPITVSGGEAVNYNFDYESGSLIITQAPLIVVADNQTREYGDENPLFPILYSGWKNGEDVTVLTTVPSVACTANEASNVGTYPITVSGGEAVNYNFDYESATLSIYQAQLTVIADDQTREYGDENPLFPILYSGWKNGEDVTVLTIEPSATCTANETSNVGTYPIIISAGEAVNYNFDYESATLSIYQAQLTVAADDKIREYGDENPALTISYSGWKNAEDVTVLTTEPSVTCTADATSNLGTYPITVSGGETVNYYFDYESGTLTITQAQLTVFADDKSREYGDENPTFPITYSGWKNGEDVTVLTTEPSAACTANAASNVGTYPIIISDGEAVNYNFNYEPGTLSITQAQLTVIADDKSREYGDENPTFPITYSGWKNGEDVTVLTTEPSATCTANATSNIGTYPITVFGGEAVNYNFDYESAMLSIYQAQLTVIADDQIREYGDENPALTISYSGWKNGEDVTVLTTEPSATCTADATSNLGIYPITVSGGETVNYYFDYETGTLTITQAQLTVFADDQTREYGDENPTLTISYIGWKNGDDITILTNAPTATCEANTTSSVGAYPITVSGGEAANYNFDYEAGTLTIDQAQLTVVADDVSREYGEETPSFPISYSGWKNGDDIPVLTTVPTATCAANTMSNVGIYPITVSGGVAVNYNIEYESGTLTIGQAQLTVVADDESREYGEENPIFAISYSGWKNGEDIAVLTTVPTAACAANETSNVGTYPITVSGGDAVNYNFDYEVATLTVTEAQLTVFTDDQSREYGDENPLFSISYSGWKNGEDIDALTTAPTATCTANATSNVGTYPITISGGEALNYSFDYESGILTITPAQLSVSADDQTREYGDENPLFSISYSGWKNEDDVASLTTIPSATCAANATSNVDTYPILISGGEALNYSFDYESGTLTITQAQLEVVADDLSREYGDENPLLTLSYSGWKNDEDVTALTTIPSATCAANITSNVDTYPITVSGGEAANYNFEYHDGVLSVIKAPLTIKAEDYTRPQGEPNPIFTLLFSGFKNNETENELNTLPSIYCQADENSPVGFYEIFLSDGFDNNYVYTLINGLLEVTPRNSVNDISPIHVQIYPNPSSNDIFIKSDLFIEKVEVFSSLGSLVLSENNYREKISISGLRIGVYFVKIYTEKGVVTSKVVKQ